MNSGLIIDGFIPPAWHWFADARRLRRERGIGYLRAPAARRVHLHLIPPWVDISAGLVVDLGANSGDWTADLLTAVPSARVLALEPYPPAHARVAKRFASRPNVVVKATAAGAENGTATFHVTSHDTLGSLLETDPALEGFYGDAARTLGEISVPVARLDDLIGESPVSLLKIDVQGAERQVFAGAERALAGAQAIVIEANFADHYRGGSRFSDVDEVLVARGFALWDISPPFRAANGRLLWADALYVRLREDPAG